MGKSSSPIVHPQTLISSIKPSADLFFSNPSSYTVDFSRRMQTSGFNENGSSSLVSEPIAGAPFAVGELSDEIQIAEDSLARSRQDREIEPHIRFKGRSTLDSSSSFSTSASSLPTAVEEPKVDDLALRSSSILFNPHRSRFYDNKLKVTEDLDASASLLPVTDDLAVGELYDGSSDRRDAITSWGHLDRSRSELVHHQPYSILQDRNEGISSDARQVFDHKLQRAWKAIREVNRLYKEDRFLDAVDHYLNVKSFFDDIPTVKGSARFLQYLANLMACYLHIGCYWQCVDLGTKILKYDSKNSSAFIYRAQAYQLLGLHEEAESEMMKFYGFLPEIELEEADVIKSDENAAHVISVGNQSLDDAAELKSVDEDINDTDAGAFVFGSEVKKTVNLSHGFPVGADESLFSKLPDQMSGMNLSRDEDLQKANTDVTGSFGSGNTSKIAAQSMKNESASSAAGQFVFGSSSGKSSVPSFGNNAAFSPSTVNKMSSEGPEKDNEMNCKEKVDAGNVYAFGTIKDKSASYGGSSVNLVRDDLDKLKIGRNTENVAGSVPFPFKSQAGKEDQRSNMGAVPSSSASGFQSPGFSFAFTSKPVGLETPHREFNAPKQDAARLTKENLFTGTYQNTAFSAKKGDAKSTRMKKKKGKSRQTAPVYQSFPAQFVSEESGHQLNPEVDHGDYSPMDYSPYREDVISDQYSREPSVASEDSTCFFSRGASADTQRSVSGDEREELLVSAAQKLNIVDSNCCQQEVGNEASIDNDDRSFNRSTFVDEQTSKFGNVSDISGHEYVDHNDLTTAPMEAETSLFSSNIDGPASEVRTGFTVSSSLEGLGESNFSFTASTIDQGPLSAAKHSHRRKNRSKSGQNPSTSTLNARVPLTSALPDLIPRISTSDLPDSVEGLQNTSFVPQSGDEIKVGKFKEAKAIYAISAAASVAEQEACEKWRFRGNQAYADGHLTKAEDYYTRGVNSVSLKEIPSSCIRPLTLCYSNRAATRMSLGKMREALKDCMMAVSIDPNFLKAQVRAANCHLALGEIGEALEHFKKCLQADKEIASDRKYLIEAADGLQKAQQVADLTGQSAELLLRRTPNDASKALNMACEALSISPHSESLLEMKADALLMMRKYEEVIKLCEQTIDLAEQNSDTIEADSQFMTRDSSENLKSSPARLWRWRLIAKSYFYLGKLDEALELLQKHEKLKPAVDRSSDSSMSLSVTIKELLRLKSAGNEAFQAARHSDAVEYYSSALTCNAESRPFTAVCLCNRAAAYQALGQITDAIADCSLAIALDSGYAKAISRRATLHEMIRDYGQAAHDLNRLVSLLAKQMEEKDSQSSGVGRSTANGTDLKRAQARLATVEAEARKGISLNMYMILGIESSSSAADIKKAYRKAALRHHPDKAGQYLVRNDNVDDGLWREVAAEVHSDADQLFKMIGEAYTILSDPAKRLQYDAEEEMRTCPVKGYNASSPKSSSDNYGSYYEKGFTRRQWRPHGNSYQRW